MGTIYDVAKKAHVSSSTVSRVANGDPRISPATKERVERAMAELGYEPNLLARSLRRHSTQMIGLIVDRLTNPFVAELAQAITEELFAADYVLTLSSTERRVDRLLTQLDILARHSMDGILLATSTANRGAEVAAKCALLAERGIPVVAVGWEIPTLSAVLPDHAAAMSLAVDHLVSLGHTRLAFLTGSPDSYISSKRQEGFLSATKLHRSKLSQALVLPSAGNPQQVAALLSESVRAQGITGIVAASDFLASGALQAAYTLGWDVPGQLSVVGCDNTTLATLAVPPLTTIDISRESIARHAVHLMQEMLASPRTHRPPAVQFMPVTLVRRGSSSTAPQIN